MEEEDARDLDGGLRCGGEGEWGVFVEPGVLGCEVSEFEVVEVVASGAAWSVGAGVAEGEVAEGEEAGVEESDEGAEEGGGGVWGVGVGGGDDGDGALPPGR